MGIIRGGIMQGLDGQQGDSAEIGAEQAEQQVSVEQPRADAVAQVRAETAQEVAEASIANVVEFIDKSLKTYLLVLGLVDILPNDFNQNLRQTVKEVCSPADFAVIEAEPNIQHPAIHRVLIRLVSNLSPNIQNALSSGNLLIALQNIVLITELSRVAGIRIPAKCGEAFSIISAFPIQTGVFGELVKRARTLLGVALNAGLVSAESVPVAVERRIELPLACDYKKVTDDMISGWDIGYLIDCSRSAYGVGDFEYVVRFQKEVVRRDPQNIESHIIIARALTELQRYQEALDERKLIASLSPDDGENKRLLYELEIRLGQKTLEIARCEDLPEGSLERINDVDFPSYMKQALENRDWGNLLRFAEEFRRRCPNQPAGYIYSAIAFEKLGRLKEALDTREALQKLILEGTVIENKSGENAVYIGLLNRKLRANLLLNDALQAEQARDWEKSVELRRKLIELNPSNLVNFYVLSFSLEHLGRFQEALDAWKKFLALPGAVVKSKYRYRTEELQYKAENVPVEVAISAVTVAPEPIRPNPSEASVGTTIVQAVGVQQHLPEAPPAETEAVVPAPLENPAQPSNIDISSFSGFLTSLQRAVCDLPVNQTGEHWRCIPDIDKPILEKAIEDLQTDLLKEFPKAQYVAFWKSFGHLYDQVFRGAINVNVIKRLIKICPVNG